MSPKPGYVAAAVNLAIFSTICVVACQYHVWKLFKSSTRTRRKALQEDKRRKIIVISGCDRGFGRLLAEKLKQSTDCIVVALTLTQQAADELKELGIASFWCDVTSDKDVRDMKRFVESIAEKEKSILHTIVNNAGIADPGDFAWFPDIEMHKRVMDVNYFGQLRVTQALLPIMLRTSPTAGGRVLNMSSVCGASASPANSSYNASKFAVEAWSDSLRLELQPFHISVVKVRPGQFSTEIQTDWMSNLVKNFDSAPDQIRELYGGDKYEESIRASIKSTSEGLTPPKPMFVVDVLMDMIYMKRSKLEPYYWLGQDAHTLWRALHSLPTTVADSVKGGLIQFHPIQQPFPPVGTFSHVTIRVRSLEKSQPFYEAFGLEPYGKAENGLQFLRSGSSKNLCPKLVLLQQDASMPARGKSWDEGMTRLCIYTTNMTADVQDLACHGLEPMAPPGKESTSIAAFTDPDGFIVYLLGAKGPLGFLIRTALWWNKTMSPRLFHWTINVTDVKTAMQIFEKLGFKTLSDQDSNQIANHLLPAFKIDPETTVIEHIRLCKLPKDGLYATLMQWVQPKTERTGSELTNSMTLSVASVEDALERARQAGMIVTDPPEYRRLPVFGGVKVGTAYVEPGSNRVEFCCFTHKQ